MWLLKIAFILYACGADGNEAIRDAEDRAR